MKRLFFALLMLSSLAGAAGTKEEIDKLRFDLMNLQKQFDGLSASLAEVNRRLDGLESRLEAVQRSSQTADLRVDLDQLKREVERLGVQLEEMRSAGAVAAEPAVTQAGPQDASGRSEGSPQQLYQDSYADYVQGRFDMALSGFRKFMELYPEHPLTENSHYWTGECLYGLKDYKGAAAALEETITKYPKGSKVLSARLKLALCKYNMGSREEAKSSLAAIVKESPGSQEAGIAREKLRVLFQE